MASLEASCLSFLGDGDLLGMDGTLFGAQIESWSPLMGILFVDESIVSSSSM